MTILASFVCMFKAVQLLLSCDCESYFIFYKPTSFSFYFCKPVNLKQKFALFSILMQTIQNIFEVSVNGCAKELWYCDYLGYVGNRVFQDLNKS
jgi:hypothetical protein